MGLILMILNGWAAVIYWKIHGIPFWQVLTALTIYWSFTLFITYWLTGKTFDLLKKWEPFRAFEQRFSEKIKKAKRINSLRARREKFLNWLVKKGNLVIGIATFIPLVPHLPTLTIVAARIVKMKYALAVLLIGNAFRVFVLCYAVYWSIGLISH